MNDEVYKLLEDIYTGRNDGKNLSLYAKKGEVCKLISDRGDVLILEGDFGRFPVLKIKAEKIL